MPKGRSLLELVIGHELRGDPIDAAPALEDVPHPLDRLSAGYGRDRRGLRREQLERGERMIDGRTKLPGRGPDVDGDAAIGEVRRAEVPVEVRQVERLRDSRTRHERAHGGLARDRRRDLLGDAARPAQSAVLAELLEREAVVV